jgi:CrcB protein
VPRLLAIALGGVLGSLARYAVVLGVGDDDPAQWPWDTLAVNLVGALLIGIIATSSAVAAGPPWVRPFAITGVLGGFTTFSAFAVETGSLLDAGQVVLAVAYVVITMTAGLLAVRLGVAIGRPR